MRTYSELIKLPTFEERFKYLKLGGGVGRETFGVERYLNQRFYTSNEWKRLRREVILRDQACDLGIEGRDIYENAIIHHMNPVSIKDIVDVTDFLMNPEYLITTTLLTHNLIHYGDETALNSITFAERKPNDTAPWRT